MDTLGTGSIRKPILLLGICVSLPVILTLSVIGILLIVVVSASGTIGGGGGSFTPPADVTPADGIPSQYVAAVKNASLNNGVPMQYVAGEVMVESSWDPNAYADYGGSHAMGLMQFEPETWSGSSDPYVQVDEPDTNATRISHYGGYGVDADGLYAPIGTPAKVSNLQELSQECSGSNNAGCAPYASPFDPTDALMSGAKYLKDLYNMKHDWPSASASYYGGSDQYSYVQKVLKYTYAYIADNPPMTNGDAYWPFGESQFTAKQTSSGYQLQGKDSNQIRASFLPSLPILAPVEGTVTWKSDKNKVQITMPLPDGETLQIQASASNAVKWQIPGNAQSAVVQAGDVVGFINTTESFTVSSSLIKAYRGVMSGDTLDPIHAGYISQTSSQS